MESIWSKTKDMPEYPALSGDVTTEAAVIGGGLAGILTAYYLQQRGIKTIVLEADRIGSGQTKNTIAKITAQHNLIYHKLIQDFGEEKAKQYAFENVEILVQLFCQDLIINGYLSPQAFSNCSSSSSDACSVGAV